MNTVDKIIYNALLQHRSLELPGIGMLVSERVPSRNAGSNQFTAPSWRIYYSKNEHPEAKSIVELIASELELDMESAAILYKRWAIEATQDNKDVIIGEVGKISKDTFLYSASFAVLLNPFTGAQIKASKCNRKVVVRVVLISVAAIVCAMIYFGGMGFWHIHEIVPQKPVVAIVKQDVQVVAPPPTVDSSDIKDVAMPVTPATVEEVKPQVAPSNEISSKVTYHLVGGVFSTMENADKCISTVKRKNSSLPTAKLPFKGTKILVSIYSSQSLPLVEAKKVEIADEFPDIWVYKQELGR